MNELLYFVRRQMHTANTHDKNKLRARLSSYGAFHEGCGGWGFGKKTENFENAFLTFQTGLGAVHSHVLVDGEGRQSTGIQRSS